MSTTNMEVDFLDFIRTGKFGFLRLGESKQELLHHGLPPEEWLNGETIASSSTWRYGNIELHFDDDHNLSGIFTDYVPDIDGGKSITISNWWILSNASGSLPLLSTMEALNQLKCDYTKTTFKAGYIELKLPNGVYFAFDHPDELPDAEHNRWTMTVIGKKMDA
ncbi:MAG: hypothetical protein ACFB10_21570 [Salibacteraceae bacterium]